VVRAIIDWLAYTEENQSGKWSGYPSWVGPELNPAGTGMLNFHAIYYGPQDEAQLSISIMTNFVNSRPDCYSAPAPVFETKSTFMDWHGPNTDEVGYTTFMSTRLILLDNIATEEAKEELVEAFAAVPRFFQIAVVAGKGVWEGDPNGETSVTPAWRTALF